MPYVDTVKTLSQIGAGKAAHLRENPAGFMMGALMAGAYVGFGIVLIFALGANLLLNEVSVEGLLGMFDDLIWVTLGSTVAGAVWMGVGYLSSGWTSPRRGRPGRGSNMSGVRPAAGESDAANVLDPVRDTQICS